MVKSPKNTEIEVYRTMSLPFVLYVCETCSVTLREKHRLKVFKNKVLRRICGPKYSPQHPIHKHPQLIFRPQCERPSFIPIQKKKGKIMVLDFKLSPCSICNVFSFGYFLGVLVLKADVSEPYRFHLHGQVDEE